MQYIKRGILSDATWTGIQSRTIGKMEVIDRGTIYPCLIVYFILKLSLFTNRAQLKVAECLLTKLITPYFLKQNYITSKSQLLSNESILHYKTLHLI